MTIGVPVVTCLPRLYQHCTNRQKQPKTVKNSQNSKNDQWCTNRHMSTKTVPTVYQSSKTAQNSQNSKNDHWCTNRHMSTKTVPTSKTAKNSQNSKNDNWRTNRHMSTKTVPTLYQSSKTAKNSQKTVKQQKTSASVELTQTRHSHSRQFFHGGQISVLLQGGSKSFIRCL